MATQSEDTDLKEAFTIIAANLETNEAKINDELISVQGAKVDLGGYYHADESKVTQVMRPSQTLNTIIDSI